MTIWASVSQILLYMTMKLGITKLLTFLFSRSFRLKNYIDERLRKTSVFATLIPIKFSIDLFRFVYEKKHH